MGSKIKITWFFLTCLFLLTLAFQHLVHADEFDLVKKVVSISQKDGKTEFKEGIDKTITYTVTLSCPDDKPVESKSAILFNVNFHPVSPYSPL